MKIIFFLFVLFLVGCSPDIITMDQLKSGNFTGKKVTLMGSFFDNYNTEYKQFADDSTYIYVKTKGNFTSRRWYALTGKVKDCQIKEGKNRICLDAIKIE